MHAKLVYDSKSVWQSRVCPDYDRVVNIDEDGNEHVVYVQCDYHLIQESNGYFRDWSLQHLIDAGIDPRTGIRTGFNTRLDAENAISSAVSCIDSVVNDSKE